MQLELPNRTPLDQPDFLPMTRRDMDRLGWNGLDVLLVSGDAYVDHPSFGIPLLGRWLVAHGYRTGIVAQPRWTGPDAGTDMTAMGRPRLFAGVSAGAIDSMLAHYTAFRKKRHDDAYTPGGKAGARPNRAVTVYANLLRAAFPGLPIVAGGIEASLRRMVHYDFWSDAPRRSILLDARLDAVLFGMGERQILDVARRLDALHDVVGDDPGSVSDDVMASFGLWEGIRGTAIVGDPGVRDAVVLPSYEDILARPAALIEATSIMEHECHRALHPLVQRHGSRTVIMEAPAEPLSTEEMDELYALPFAKAAHPSYTRPIPALTMIRESITSHRGCGGGCSFCSLSLHQGRRISSRSRDSIIREVRDLASRPWFNGSVSDIGGPSANMWMAGCSGDASSCGRTSCMFPAVCPKFIDRQERCIDLLRAARDVDGVRHVRVASGVRFDLALRNPAAMKAYTGEFTGGQLKIAPEHCSPEVLRRMRKPGMQAFERFLLAFREHSEATGKEQYVVPYLMSAFPGCTDAHMRELAAWLRARRWSPRQVQCFIPTPGSMATAMYYAEQDEQGRPLFVVKTDAARRRQHDILLNTEKMGITARTTSCKERRHGQHERSS